MHRNGGDGGEAIGQGREHLGIGPVEGAAQTPSVALVGCVEEDESDARIDDAEVEAEFVEPLVEQSREQRRGQVDGLACR